MAEILRKVVGVFKFKDEASKEVDKVNSSMDEGKGSALSMQGAIMALGGAAVLMAVKSLASASLEAAAALETQQVRLKNLSGESYPELKSAMDEAIASSQGLSNEGDMSYAINQALKYGASVDMLKGSMGSMQKLAAITGDDLGSMFQGISQDVATGSTRFIKQNAILSKHMDAFRKLGAGYDEATKKKRELFIVDIMQKEQLAIQEQYNEVMNTTNAMLDTAGSQWGNVKERIGALISVALKPLLKVLNKVLRFLGETEEGAVILKLAIISLTPVIGVGLVAAFYAAATAAWAFITPFLPFIAIALLIAAAIAAIVLVVQDLITWFKGGDSVIGQFFENVFNWFKELPGKMTEWLKNSTIGKFLLKIIPSFGVEARAMGGPVSTGQPYIVGEKGPELFIPGSGGQVLSNEESSNLSESDGAGIGSKVMINSLIGTLTINVDGEEGIAENIKNVVLDALNDLSRNVLRAETGLQIT